MMKTLQCSCDRLSPVHLLKLRTEVLSVILVLVAWLPGQDNAHLMEDSISLDDSTNYDTPCNIFAFK